MKTNFNRCVEEKIRPNIVRLEPYHCAREKVLGGILLDANENPYQRLQSGVRLNRYPDPYQRSLREALAKYARVEPAQVLAGSGSDEVLDWIFKVFCEPGRDQVAIPEPTYGMYRVMAEIFNVAVEEYRLGPNFGFDAGAFLRQVGSQTKLLFLCSPNNPTGNLIDRQQIIRVLEEWEGVVVLDEAYVEFSDSPSFSDLLARYSRLILMRTFSKAFGRAAVRLGYALADPLVINYFMKVKAPYNLNAWTMKEGEQALSQLIDSNSEIGEILRERRRVSQALAEMEGIETVFPSQANFILFKTAADTGKLSEALLEDGIIVRDRSSLPGLNGTIRVTIGTPYENRIFLERLEDRLKRMLS